MKFDFSGAVKAKESGNFLSAGIKDATFQGIELSSITSQKTGDDYKVLSLKLNIDGYGEYTQNFFEPQSDERTKMQWGYSASPLDHFLIIIREILEAINPQVLKAIEEGKEELSGNFKQIVKSVKEFTDPFIGTKVQIKLIPQNNGFVSMPSYPARITKNEELGIATWIIGHDLTLTPKELKAIEAAKNAAPTNMASKEDSGSILDKMDKALGDSDSDDDSDLPF